MPMLMRWWKPALSAAMAEYVWYNTSRMKHVCHGCKYQGYFKSKLCDCPDNYLVSDTTVHNVTLLVLHFNVVVVLSSNNMRIPCHGHPIRTGSLQPVFIFLMHHWCCSHSILFTVNTSFPRPQAYVWRFDPVHPKTFVLGVLVGKWRNVQHTRSITGRQTGNRFSVRDMSAIEHRPPHLYECLWRRYFRTRNIVTLLSPVYLCCLGVLATSHEPSPLLATCNGSGVLAVVVFFS